MSLIITASQAATLVGRHERIIRGWIASGQLKATKSTDGKFQIATDDLLKAPHVDLAHHAIIQLWVMAGGIQPEGQD